MSLEDSQEWWVVEGRHLETEPSLQRSSLEGADPSEDDLGDRDDLDAILGADSAALLREAKAKYEGIRNHNPPRL